MWVENDGLMELAKTLNGEGARFPTTCPVCGRQSCHALMYNPSSRTSLGSIWIWCDSCGSYTHFRGLVPEWVGVPDFIDEGRLCSDVEYPSSVREEADAWLSEMHERLSGGSCD